MPTYVFVFVMNAAWQATALFVVGLLLAQLLRRSAAAWQCLLWTAVLASTACVPLLSLVWTGGNTGNGSRWAWQGGSTQNLGLWLNGGSAGSHSLSGRSTSHFLFTGIVTIYLLFLLIQVIRTLRGWRLVRKIVDGSSVWEPSRAPHLVKHAGAEVRVSREALVPFAVGFFHPVIVIPEFLVFQPQEEMLAVVLAHESAHIRRKDWIVNLALLLVSAPVSFHPCVALMKKKVEAAREAACDEIALGCMASASVYARALLDLAGRLAQPQPSLVAAYKGAALGVLDGSTLGDRIRRLMDRSPRHSTQRSRALLCLGVGALLLASIAVTKAALAAPLPTPSNGSVAGTWTGQFIDPKGPGGKPGHTPIYLHLEETGSAISGEIGPDAASAVPIETAEMTGNQLRLTTVMKHAETSVTWSLTFTIQGDHMSGTGHAVRNDQHSWEVEANLSRTK